MNKNLLSFFLLFAILIICNTAFAQQKNINVTNFVIKKTDNKVKIDWKTDGAIATNYFAIQKSTDGINFKTVALVLGPDPKQKNGDCYECIDKDSKDSKTSYYRLIHVDNDGREQIAETKTVAIS